MTIKQQGGVFGRNPSFNDTETNDLIVNDKLGVGAGTPATNAKAHISRASSGASVLANTTLALESTGDVILDMLSPATGRALIVFGNASSSQRGDLLYDHNADTLRVRVGNTTQATFNTSGLAFPSGKGIDFSATSGTGTSELFDDYEEGTWTPTLTTDATDFTSVTYDGLTSGVYTKIGNVVQISGTLRTDAITVGSASGTVLIGGLPFTAAAPTAVAVGSSSSWNVNHPNAGEVRSGTTALALLYRALANGAATNVAPADCRTTGDSNLLRFSAVYRT